MELPWWWNSTAGIKMAIIEEMEQNKIIYADDDYESVNILFSLRILPLVIGLVLGIVLSFVTSRFEEVLIQNIQVAFFLPFIVYIANAIGSQTQTIYAGDLKTGQSKFSNYFHKELILGLIFGLVFAGAISAIAHLWLKNPELTLSLALATFLAISLAPLIAVITTYLFYRIHKDPAASSGPVATVFQDMTSILIYGTVCSLIIL